MTLYEKHLLKTQRTRVNPEAWETEYQTLSMAEDSIRLKNLHYGDK